MPEIKRKYPPRSKVILVRLIRALIKSNSDSVPVRKRLKGVPREKDKVVQKLQELVYKLRASGDGRSWAGRSAEDTLTHDLRAQLSNAKLSATLRCDAAISLAVLGGFLPASELGNGARDQYIRRIVGGGEPVEAETVQSESALSDVEKALKKFAEEQHASR
jgi:hypothetical protein